MKTHYQNRITKNILFIGVSILSLLLFACAPEVDVGQPQTVSPGETVTLTGSATDPDPEHIIASYRWVQLSGAPVNLSDDSAPVTTFVAPNTLGVLTFELTATDNEGIGVRHNHR